MKLYNSLTQTVDEFFVKPDNTVRIYVCGITPYDTTHIGHAFTYLVFDVLIRYLRHKGHVVIFTENVTDLDDPLFERAAKLNVSWRRLADEQTEQFLNDMASLQVQPPTYYVKASEEIPTMIAIIEKLIADGYAYVAQGNVYFEVSKDPAYGKMAHLDYQEMLETANERGNWPNDKNKRDPLDFVLWQTSQPGEPVWPSPWGRGRPGWHIECSAMCYKYLGDQIDIHGGGSDLIFPHHTSEIAQIEHYTGVSPAVRFWVHTGMVSYNGEKMSKSLGNLVLVRNLLPTFTADTVRLYLLSFPYRSSWIYEDEGLQATVQVAERMRDAALVVSGETAVAIDPAEIRAQFYEAMDNDLNISQAITILNDLAGLILTSAESEGNVWAAQQLLAELGDILGLTLQ